MYLSTISGLAGRIALFQQSLTQLNTAGDVGQNLNSRLLLIHMLVNCAIVQLHRPLDSLGAMGIATNSQTFMAAFDAANGLSQTNIGALTFVDPAVGVSAQITSTSESDIFAVTQSMLVSVAGALIDGLRFLRKRASTASVPVGAEEQSIAAALGQIRSVMTAWGERSVYMSTWNGSFPVNIGLTVSNRGPVDHLARNARGAILALTCPNCLYTMPNLCYSATHL